LTVTALAKEQLNLQVQQLQNQLENQNNWLANNSTALIAAAATVIVALFGILQWAITVRQAQDKDLRDREEERRKELAAQDKELRDRAEERFKVAVTALGDENEATQIGGVILLRSFLNPDDKETYRRYYTQIFDLAVAYLRLSNTSHSPEGPGSPALLTPLRQALVSVFQEVFSLARDLLEQSSQSLDASFIHLDRAYVARCDLKDAYMRKATFRSASLHYAKLNGANLYDTDFSSLPESAEADLRIRQTYLGWTDLSKADLRHAKFKEAKLLRTNFTEADLRWADLSEAHFIGTFLCGANLSKAKLNGAVFEVFHIPKDKTKDKIKEKISRVNLRGANLSEADLSEADLKGVNLEDALLLKDANLRGVKGLTKEQLAACKAKGAIVDEDITASSPQPPVTLAQVNVSPPSLDGSTNTSS